MRDRWRGWSRQLRVLVRKSRVEAELDEEIAFHLEKEAERLVGEGLDRREAVRRARLAFGGVDSAKEAVRDARWVRGLEDLAIDLRLGFRALRRRPGFAVAAVLTLALGVGGTTAVSTVVRSVLLEPLAYEEPGQLVRIHQFDAADPDEALFVSAPFFLGLAERSRSFEQLAAVYTFHEVGADLRLAAGTRRIRVLPVSADYFRLLRREPILGRAFLPEEESGAPVAVVSPELWRRLGPDSGGLGATIGLDGVDHRIVGVAPEDLEDPLVGRVDAWVPQNLRVGGLAQNPGNHHLSVLGRLAPGLSIEPAREELAALAAALVDRFPEVDRDGGFLVEPLREELVSAARPALLASFAAMVLVLAIACVSLANLLLVRSAERSVEVSVRTALGAAGGRIARQLLVENLAVAALGGLAGVAVAFGGLAALLRLGGDAIPRAGEIRLDGPVLAGALGLALVTASLAALVPAWRSARAARRGPLPGSVRSVAGSAGLARLRRILVAAQIGLAMTLAVGAATLTASLHRLARVDLGFRAEGVLAFQLNLPPGHYDAEDRRLRFREVLDRLDALPGVRAAGGVTVLPATGSSYRWGTRAATGPLAGTERGFVGADQRIVSGRGLEALGIELVDGRLLDGRDGPDAEPTALVSAGLAARLFPGVSPLGQEIRAGGRDRRVVGVVADVALDPLGTAGFHVYHAHAQWESSPATLEILVAGEESAASLLPAVREAVAELDPYLVVHRAAPLREIVLAGIAHRRFAFGLVGAFAGLALVLAAVGLYGVLAFGVRTRRREIGVRAALGAGPGRLVALVLEEGLRTAVLGILLGSVGALATGSVLSSLVYETRPTDPVVLLAVGLVLLATAGLASFVPARRALRVPPREALLGE